MKTGFKGNKSCLPAKTCAACGRAMSWRYKWAQCWDAVKYCSERCRRQCRHDVGHALHSGAR